MRAKTGLETMREYHAIYEALPFEARTAIDDAYTAATQCLRDAGFEITGDDRAEKLISAITLYYIACGNPTK